MANRVPFFSFVRLFARFLFRSLTCSAASIDSKSSGTQSFGPNVLVGVEYPCGAIKRKMTFKLPGLPGPRRKTVAIPFVHRLSCTIAEACEATGLGRTKLYELIGDGHLATTTVGRRRLVLVRSLLSLLLAGASEANWV